MARDHARMMLTMWDDPDWLDLTVSQHQVYWVIEASHALSTAGVAPLVPARYCRGADQTPAKVMRDIKALAARRFLLVDHDTVELAVRAHIRRDGVLRMPNMIKSLSRSFQQILSEPIRAGLETEIVRGLAEQYPEGIPDTVRAAFSGEFGEGYSEGFQQTIALWDERKGSSEGIE